MVARETVLKIEIEEMKKRQSEMDEQMRQFLSSQSNHCLMDGIGGVGGHEVVNEDDEDEEANYLVMVGFFIVIYICGVSIT